MGSQLVKDCSKSANKVRAAVIRPYFSAPPVNTCSKSVSYFTHFEKAFVNLCADFCLVGFALSGGVHWLK